NPSVIEKAREGGPALEHVVHRFGGFGMAGESCPLGPHPILKAGNQWHDAAAARRKTFLDRKTVDLTLDVEDHINLLHRFERERRKDRQLAARLGGDGVWHKELAPRVGPAGSFDNRPRRTISRIEPVESRISVS